MQRTTRTFKSCAGVLIAATAALWAGGAPAARAEVKLPAVLSDHMVLQRDLPVPVWGTADAGEAVTVTFAGQTQSAKAGEDGRWTVRLKPMRFSDRPADLTVAGTNTLTLKDVLVGEVWVCSGQSNMEFVVNSAKDREAEVKNSDFPNIRLFTVPKSIKAEPQSDTKGEWAACGPKTVGGFSAVGYFFGRDVYKQLNVPVGLIHTSWGGTPAEAWTPRAALEAEADFATILTNGEKARQPEVYAKQLEDWKAAAEKAKAENKPEPRKPRDPGENPNLPSVLYNGMIAPILPYAIRGATWYQGESNAGRAEQYRTLLPAMIGSWRQAWHEPEMKFLIVQLANYQKPADKPGDDDWAELREAQTMTAALPNNGMAVAIDLADVDKPEDIHPHNKQDVGHRLALTAMATVYGKKEVEYAGPTYESMKVDGNKAMIHLAHAAGLTARAMPTKSAAAPADAAPVESDRTIKGFQIAGEDKQWHWADAKIERDGVVSVWSDNVEKPAAVRYDWSHNPQGNLYNEAGLPAAPFRTDTWPGVTAGRK